MRSDSSSLEATRIPFSICFVILLKKLSIMFNHDVCVGVKQIQTFPLEALQDTALFPLKYALSGYQVLGG